MTKGRNLLLGGSILAAVALTVSACGQSHAGTTSSFKANPGATIEYALPPQSNLNWFLPVVNAPDDSIQNFQFIYQMYKPLLWVNANYTVNWKTSIAKKITYNPQGTVYHVFLHHRWHWSNGQPVTSQDVLFTWSVIQAASQSNVPSPWPYVGLGTGDIPNGIQSVVANNNYELTITLKQPANQQWFIFNGIIQLIPMPKGAWDVHKNMKNELVYLGDHSTDPQFDQVVDGPFKIGPSITNQYWTLVPNTHYDGHKAEVRRVIFEFEGSNDSEFAALKSGSVNVGYLDPSQYGARTELTRQGDVITPEYLFGYYETQLNMFPGSPVKSLFDQLYMRQALQLGLNREAIDKDVYHGYAPSIDGPIPGTPKTSFLAPDLASNPYPYNPSRGKRLLEAHGWHLVNGVMEKNGVPLKLTLAYPSGSGAETTEVQLMKQDWAREGIDVSLRGMPGSNLESLTYSPSEASRWEMSTGLAWFYDGPGYWPTGGQLFASNAPSGFGYSNRTEDQLIAATHRPYDNPKQTLTAFYRYEDFTARHLPVLWQNNVGTLAVHAGNVHGSVKYADASVGFPQMQYWWVSQ